MRRWNFELNCAAQRGGKQVDALGSLRSVTEVRGWLPQACARSQISAVASQTDAPGRSTPAGAAEERKKLQMKYAVRCAALVGGRARREPVTETGFALGSEPRTLGCRRRRTCS